MSQRDKLLERLKSKPKDFTWSEMETVLRGFGYEQQNGDGSRRKFFNPTTQAIVSLHEPHPTKILKSYQIRDVVEHLKGRDLL